MFWLITSMNDEVQHDIDMNICVTDIPSSITLMNSAHDNINVSVGVKDRGINVLIKKILNKGTIKIPFKDFTDDGHRILLSDAQLSAALRQYFGPYSSIVSHDPDSLSLPYTSAPPIKLPVRINANIVTQPQYIVNGPLKPSIDSVLVFTTGLLADSLSTISTRQVSLKGINDTTVTTAMLVTPVGCRVIPDQVEITVPVEPLISKTIEIPVEILNLPENKDIIVFPNSVKFTCLVPMSTFNDNSFPIKAYANFDERKDNVIPLEISILPDNFINGKLSPDVIEYIEAE